MRSNTLLIAASLALLTACQDSPVQPPTVLTHALKLAVAPSASLTPTPTPPCTHHWASAVSGSWDDASKWSPTSVPGTSSVACIDASGTYTVTISRNTGDPTVTLNALAIGGASGTATFRENQANMSVTQGANIAATGALDFNSFSAFTFTAGGVVTNDGQITSGGSFLEDHVTLDADVLNRGTFSNTHNGSVSFTNHTVVNQGTMDFSNRVTNISGSNPVFEQQSGVLTGSGPASFIALTGKVRYLGGRVDSTTCCSGVKAVVRLDGANLELQTTSAVQPVYFDMIPPGATLATVTGDIGANVRVRLIDNAQSNGLTLKGTLTNFGLLDVISVSQPKLDPEVKFVNRGRIVISSDVHVKAPFENRGSVTWTGQGGLYFDDINGTYDNFGSIIVTLGALTVGNGSTLRIQSGSTTTTSGTMYLDTGVLTGSGAVGANMNLVHGGTISPGLPFGTLSVGNISSPDNSGTLKFDIGGPTPGTGYDQLFVNSLFSFALNIVINTIANTPACGIVANLVTAGQPPALGAWASVSGLNSTPNVRWTPGPNAQVWTLYGSNPASTVGIGPSSVNIAEGGPSKAYSICLSQLPLSNVAVTPTADAQETVPFGALVFTPSNWFVPQTVAVTAVDDALIEGPHTGHVTHAVISGDPAFNNVPVASLTANITDNDGSADLKLTIPQPPPPLTVGQTFSVGFRDANSGPTLSTGASLKITANPAFKFVSAIGTTCGASGGFLVCTLSGTASGGQVNVTLNFKALTAGTFPITITLTGQQSDPNPANNVVVKNVTVN